MISPVHTSQMCCLAHALQLERIRSAAKDNWKASKKGRNDEYMDRVKDYDKTETRPRQNKENSTHHQHLTRQHNTPQHNTTQHNTN